MHDCLMKNLQITKYQIRRYEFSQINETQKRESKYSIYFLALTRTKAGGEKTVGIKKIEKKNIWSKLIS